MFWPPWITTGRRSIHCTFHITEVRWTFTTGSITQPPVHTVIVHLIMESMVHLSQQQENLRTDDSIGYVHLMTQNKQSHKEKKESPLASKYVKSSLKCADNDNNDDERMDFNMACGPRL